MSIGWKCMCVAAILMSAVALLFSAVAILIA